MRRSVAVMLTVALALSACGDDGEPGGFLDDPGPIDPSLTVALDEGVDPDTVPLVQRNFIDTCVRGGSSSLPEELALVQERGLLRVCGCGYDAIVSHFRQVAAEEAADDASAEEIEEDAYERFRDLDDDLRTGSGDFGEDIEALFAACIRQEAF